MNIEEFRETCISIRGAVECFPFDDQTLVFKVMDKMFACIGLDHKPEGFFVMVKCDPERAIELREHYTGILPGYHFNKKHWNSVYLESDVPDSLIKELIQHSRDQVIKKLPKVRQAEYHNMVDE